VRAGRGAGGAAPEAGATERSEAGATAAEEQDAARAAAITTPQRPLVSHLVGTMISPLRMLALDSDVCPTPVTYTVAPLNTYTFLKRGTDGADL